MTPIRLALLAVSLCLALPLSAESPRGRITIGYLVAGGDLSREDSAVVSWLSAVRAYPVHILDVARDDMENPGVDIVWIHVPDSAAWAVWLPYSSKLRSLGSFCRNGGKLLCTGVGAMVPWIAGLESEKPGILPLGIRNDGISDQKGIQGFRGHPVFEGLFGGVFTWDTDVDNVVDRTGFFGGRSPREGKVVGVEKSYVSVESDNKLMIEYAPGKGRALSIGAYVRFGLPNAAAPRLGRFITNALGYLARPRGGGTFWLRADCRPRPFRIATPGLPPARAFSRVVPHSGLLIRRESPRNEFYDLAGRRALIMGKENGGIDELWVHPFRVMRDFKAGLVTGDSIRWLSTFPLTLDIRPESITRTYTTGEGILEEMVFPSFRRGGALVRYRWAGNAQGTPLVVTFRSDLRWMWPYDERALGDVYFGYDDSLHALHVRDVSGDFYCIAGGSIAPLQSLSGQFGRISLASARLTGEATGANQVLHASMYDLEASPARELTFAVVGSDGGMDRALADYRSLLHDPGAEYAALVGHYRSLIEMSVTVESPDSVFDARWKWALVGVDRFVAETPRLGTGLLAGFSTVDRGWDGGRKISGRPGYAWYFGRDGAWSGFAVDGYGDFATVRSELELLGKYQDVSGKIFHECTTSGVVHYDASDATPLYVLLAADYVNASGDREFFRKTWPRIRKAMDFLYSTDTDGDLLIENTNVGHGWVEGGNLLPVQTEFYLAGLWGEALHQASWMASLAGENLLSAKYGRDAAAVRRSVDAGFWNPATGSYSFGKLKDGSYNPEPTILQAPVMGFGWLDDRRVLRALAQFAGAGFSTDWGTRIVSDGSPLFNPGGYHEGSVWPLFTGWTALAEYEYGNSTQAFSHMASTMETEDDWEAGFVQEVLNGSVYKPAGVCPHQCWSETGILHPGIRGMIGWSPRALENAAALSPRFPITWSRALVRNLRVGSSALNMSFAREGRAIVYRLVLARGRPVAVDFAPEVPAGTTITRADVDGRQFTCPASRSRGLLAEPVRVLVRDSTEIRFECAGGVGVVPPVAHPFPGDSSTGLRFLDGSLDGLDYGFDVEGKSGSAGTIRVVTLDQEVLSVSGGTLTGEHSGRWRDIRIRFGAFPSGRAVNHVVVKLGKSPG